MKLQVGWWHVRLPHQGRVPHAVLGDDATLFEKPLTGLHEVSEQFWLGHFLWARPRLTK